MSEIGFIRGGFGNSPNDFCAINFPLRSLVSDDILKVIDRNRKHGQSIIARGNFIYLKKDHKALVCQTAGSSLQTNIALVMHNAEVGAEIAVELLKQR